VSVEKLIQLVAFCENKCDCRRVQLLEYFGESFTKDQCQQNCDNCLNEDEYENTDVTEEARSIITAAREMGRGNTMADLLDVYRGSKNKNVVEKMHDQISTYAAGRSQPKERVERIVRHMVIRSILVEDAFFTGPYSSVSSQLRVGPKGRLVEQGKMAVICPLPKAKKRGTPKAREKNKKKQESKRTIHVPVV